MKTFFKKIWAGWKIFAHKLGVFQTKLLLTIMYFIIIAIAAILARIFGRDLLDRRLADKGSMWKVHDEPVADLESAKRQF